MQMAAIMTPTAIVFALLLSAVCHCQSERYLQVYPPYDETDHRTPLTFALLHSFGGSFVSSGAVAGVQVALDTINSANPEVLPGYSLHYTLTDSQCSRTVSHEGLFKQVLSDPNDPDDPVKIGVLGAGCSVATEATAEISHFYNIAQISCSASSPSLENREKFRSYFQLLPNQADIAPAYFGVIQQFEWRRVALIVQNENLFTVTMDRLKLLLDTIDVNYTESIFESEEGIAGLGAEPFDPESRIFIFATYANSARALLCEAYTQQPRYPQHLFMTYGWFPDQWWEQQPDDENLTCTAAQRNTVLQHTLALLQYDFPEHLNKTATTDTGITAAEYAEREAAHLSSNSLGLEMLLASPYCHDATWTLAKALRLTIDDLQSNDTLSQLAWETQAVSTSETFRLENFTYSNDVIRDAIFGHLQQTDFTGVSGPVLFSDSGLRKVNVRRVFQFRASGENGVQLERVNIALVTSDGREPEGYRFQYFPDQNDAITWPRGIPYDGVPNEEFVSVNLALAVVFLILSAAGILFALICIVFNFVYRERLLIRISSHNLNYFIAVGAIILYVDIILSVIPTTNPDAVAVLCTLTPWLIAIGYSLCYGTVVVKMWRVAYIFNNPSPQMAKAPKDWMLVLVVGALILIDITILLVYTAVEGYRGNLVAIQMPNRENMEDIEGELAVITRYFIYICDSRARDAFLGVLYGYKGVLQVMTLVLAFFIRKVKVKGLNDTKYILAAIYVSSIVLAVIIVSTYSLNEFINVNAAVFCTGFFIGTTVILGLVFGPKMVGLYRDPEGKQIFAKSDPTTFTEIKPSSDMDSLRRRVKELENLVSQKQANSASAQENLVYGDVPEKTISNSSPEREKSAEC